MDIESSTTNIEMNVQSPIHIGTGEGYSRSEFCIDKRSVRKRINGKPVKTKADKLLKLNLDKISGIILKQGDDDFKRFISTIKKSGSMDKFFKNSFKNNNPKVYDKLIKSEVYPCHYKCKKGELLSNQGLVIKENVKTKHIPYIPGSSIKGSIRNAILYSAIDKIDPKNVRRDVDGINKSLNDVMKHLNFTDAFCIKDIAPTIYKTKSINTKRNTTSFLETIDRGKKSKLKFGFYNTSLERIDSEAHSYDVKKIFSKLHIFYNDLLDYEIDFADKNDLFEFESYCSKLKKINKKESPVIRLGGGSGALSVSQLLKIKDELDENQFYDFRVNEGIGGKWDNDARKHIYYKYNFPKTRRLLFGNIDSEGNPILEEMPLGWAKLKIGD